MLPGWRSVINCIIFYVITLKLENIIKCTNQYKKAVGSHRQEGVSATHSAHSMGNSFGGIKRAVEEEFERVRLLGKEGRQYIVLDQVLQIENTKWESYPIDFTHLGTLFMLDKEKNGKFTIYVRMLRSLGLPSPHSMAHFPHFLVLL